MSKFEAAVVIPVYNEAKLIRRPIVWLGLSDRLIEKPIPLIVVDNGSTDETVDVVRHYAKATPGVQLHLLEEPEKGTGSAADTGFRYAIDELGSSYIGRLDADVWPSPLWFAAMHGHLKEHPDHKIVTGLVDRGFDVPDKARNVWAEDIVVPAAKKLTRLARALKYGAPAFPSRFAPGYNLGTTAEAYTEVGGFPRTSISESDEDLAYNIEIDRHFGAGAFGYERSMHVFASSRRMRSAGYLRSALHYASPSSRPESGIDPRL
jgi:glycosyltransferase involved in cell wall biosynthesis